MTEERKQLLDSIGLKCDLSTKNVAAWEEMYERLVAYKKEYKDTKVPYNYKKDPKLACWADRQRTVYRNKTIKEEHKQMLDSIDFKWDVYANAMAYREWERMINQLTE